MTQDYLAAISELKENPELTVDEAARRHSHILSGIVILRRKLKRKKKTEFEENYIRKVRIPAIHCHKLLHGLYIFTEKYQVDRIFPDSSSENRVICVPGKGLKNPFSALITNTMTDLNFCEAGAQCFPRWQYPRPADASNTTGTFQGFDEAPERIDNISDTALHAFRNHYRDNSITKDDIFDYIYGILHAPSYREEFANDLSKMIPRIPFAPDFRAFAEAGKALADLHLNYETCEQYPYLKVEPVTPSLLWEPEPEHFRLGTRAMRFADKEAKTTLTINEHVCLSGIPEEAHQLCRQRQNPTGMVHRPLQNQERTRNSGIINDPNGWFQNPRDLITAIERIVHISVESTKIIENLPSKLTDD